MQRIFCGTRLEVLQDVRELMEKGWCIVPGTTVISSVEFAANEYYAGARTPNGTAFETYLSATLEIDSEE